MNSSTSNASECLSETALAAIACDRADHAELQRYESHLETCASCREQLEAASADPPTWDSVRAFLRDDDFDQQRFGCGRGTEQNLTAEAAELLRFLAPTDDPHMLGRLGTYEVSGIVGAGGMGIVLKALEPALARFVALKVLAPRFWKDSQARERFAREARAAASIVHENVIEIYGVAEVNGIPFFAMPYLRGDTLQARIDRQGPLKVEEILRVSMQVASGLAAAHAQGLVHRDIKPANILLGAGAERVRITDFGIAHLGADPRLTQSGLVAGTPQYMSPEQVRGENVDGRSDLFSLGSVMFAMGAGRPPFEGDSNYQLLHKVATAASPRLEAVNPAIPSWLAAVVAKLHAPSPEDRYPSAKELAGDLEQCLASWQQPRVVSRPRSITRLEAKYRRRRHFKVRRLLIGGLLMFGLAIIVMVTLFSGFLTPTASVAADSIKVEGRVVDGQGAAVADATILAVKKTWPNNRFQQQMLKTTTDDHGRFAFEDFAQPGKQYAFLLSVISDQWLMTSEYRVVKDGKQQKPITLETEKSEPVTITFVERGKPVPKVRSLPTRRTLADGGLEYLSYPQHVRNSGASSDERGQVRFGSWKAGEKGEIAFVVDDDIETFEFTVPENRVVFVPARRSAKKASAGPPIHVSGMVVAAADEPVADVNVLAIQKTWPDNHFQQQTLKTTTDKEGRFSFEDFAQPGKQYAFLLSVISDQWLMTSEYRVVKDGKQQDPITLETEKSEPVTIKFVDSQSKPIPKIRALPTRRVLADGTEYLNYPQHVRDSGAEADEAGAVRFGSWKAGEKAAIAYLVGDEIKTFEFTAPEFVVPTSVAEGRPAEAGTFDGRVVRAVLQIPATLLPAGPPVHVAGRVVDAAGKPVANVKVFASRFLTVFVVKSAPNKHNRGARRDLMSAVTDEAGNFRFDDVANSGNPYDFNLAVAVDGYAMAGERLDAGHGSQQEPVTLRLEQAEPVTLVFKDSAGNLLEGVDVSPSSRKVDKTTLIFLESDMKEPCQRSDQKGEVSFTAWKPGELGSIQYHRQQSRRVNPFSFTVGEDRRVTITILDE